MSKIYVAEYSGLATTDQSDSVAILALPPTVEYTVIVSAGSSGSAQSIQPSTKFVEISCDTTCSIAIGVFPGTLGTGSAGLSNQRLNANDRVIRRVPYQQQSTGPGVYNTITTPYGVFTTANI
jgi:hypothetical protein